VIPRCGEFEPYPFLFSKVVDDAKEIFGAGIAGRAEHAHDALADEDIGQWVEACPLARSMLTEIPPRGQN
jgi:hypothetical protein